MADLVERQGFRLAQLAVPRAVAEGLSLEGGQLEGLPPHVGHQRGGIVGLRPGRGLAETAQRDPDLIILVPGRPPGGFLEAGLPLGGAPGLVRRVPAARDQPGRARDGARLHIPVTAAGSEALLDAFAQLPDFRTETVLDRKSVV